MSLRTRVLRRLAEGVDRAVMHAMRDPSDDDPRRLRQRIEAAQAFAKTRAGVALESIFPAARDVSALCTETPRGGSIDLRWPSAYADPHDPANQSVHVRLYRGAERRPVALIVHGYGAGHAEVQGRTWPLSWLRRQGLDVALFTLPFHGVRGQRSLFERPAFPSDDHAATERGFQQVVSDLRDAIGYLLSAGHPAVGLMGMSLGGYAAALTATLDERVAFLVPVVPLASLADWVVQHCRCTPGAQLAAYHAALEDAYRLVSPLSRPPKLSPARVAVIGGKADRVTPVSHARRLARHFSAPIVAWPGGHLMQRGRQQAFERIAVAFRDL